MLERETRIKDIGAAKHSISSVARRIKKEQNLLPKLHSYETGERLSGYAWRAHKRTYGNSD